MEIKLNAGKNLRTGLELKNEFSHLSIGNVENSISIGFNQMEYDLQDTPYKGNGHVVVTVEGVQMNNMESKPDKFELTDKEKQANIKILNSIRLEVLTILNTKLPLLKLITEEA